MPTIIYADDVIEEIELAGFDESLHPRSPKGNETGGEWTKKTVNPAPPESIESFRDDHWESTKETAIILDQDGKPVRTVGGNKKYSVDFEKEDQELMINGGSMIHNHPRGTALSDGDIILASDLNLKSVEAFGFDPYTKEKISWVIEQPSEGWPARARIKRAYKIYADAYVFRARDQMKTKGWDSWQAANWMTNNVMARVVDSLKLKMVRNVYP